MIMTKTARIGAVYRNGRSRRVVVRIAAAGEGVTTRGDALSLGEKFEYAEGVLRLDIVPGVLPDTGDFSVDVGEAPIELLLVAGTVSPGGVAGGGAGRRRGASVGTFTGGGRLGSLPAGGLAWFGLSIIGRLKEPEDNLVVMP